MRIVVVTLLLLVTVLGIKAQDIAAFSDYKKMFYVFDKGNIRQLEYQPVLSYAVGDKCVGYVTNGNHFKIYNNHLVYDVASMVSSYKVTDNLVSYQIGTQLYVFENGNKRVLSKFVGHYMAGDSLVAFFDTEKYFFEVYYNGKIITLEDGLLFSDASRFKVGRNMLGYIDAYGNFKVFYQGEVTEIAQTSTITGEIGRNVMAYIDPVTEFLNVFYKGEIIELTTFKPKSFQVGFEKVAYVTQMGDFMLFDDGETYTISDIEPDKYKLKDDMIAYTTQDQLYAFYHGDNYLIENYIPVSFEVQQKAIAYMDLNGYLKLFEDGEQKTLTYERINDYTMLRNVIIYNIGMNTINIYYNGKTYEP